MQFTYKLIEVANCHILCKPYYVLHLSNAIYIYNAVNFSADLSHILHVCINSGPPSRIVYFQL
jgi:hypothetical protein